MILLYNRIKSRVAAEQDLLLDEAEIDAILLGRDSGQPDAVSQIVRHQAQEFVSDLLSSLRERMLELKSGKVIFTGGGAVLLRGSRLKRRTRCVSLFSLRTSLQT